jgi:hypothetical protein
MTLQGKKHARVIQHTKRSEATMARQLKASAGSTFVEDIRAGTVYRNVVGDVDVQNS